MNLNDMARKLKGLVKFLIDWDDDVNVTNEYEDGKAPLHDTEHQGYIKIAELLIKNGANVNVGSGSSQFFEITNVANLIIIVIAQTQFDISLMTSLKLWFIAQCLNVSFSYSRRMFFHTYNEQILGFFSRYASQK